METRGLRALRSKDEEPALQVLSLLSKKRMLRTHVSNWGEEHQLRKKGKKETKPAHKKDWSFRPCRMHSDFFRPFQHSVDQGKKFHQAGGVAGGTGWKLQQGESNVLPCDAELVLTNSKEGDLFHVRPGKNKKRGGSNSEVSVITWFMKSQWRRMQRRVKSRKGNGDLVSEHLPGPSRGSEHVIVRIARPKGDCGNAREGHGPEQVAD